MKVETSYSIQNLSYFLSITMGIRHHIEKMSKLGIRAKAKA